MSHDVWPYFEHAQLYPQQLSAYSAKYLTNKLHILFIILRGTRAGHTTILSRQCDQLSGHTVVCNCYFTIFIVATPSKHWGLTIFRFFSGPWGYINLSPCRCRENKKNVACPAQRGTNMKQILIILPRQLNFAALHVKLNRNRSDKKNLTSQKSL